MRIINIKKFIRGIGIIVFLIILTILIIGNNVSLSHGELQYKDLYVASGDTLWSIATNELNNNSNFRNLDIREIIKEIKDINNLNSSVLYVGQKLVIPMY